ncbi:26S proteasome non-ATPase regulatory subunit 4 [Tritrichomonas musculus]|uniref:26S proteasome non-ATPase regulatory subunit 4 n=1 Tax=Tritrichomonas musculus TaxID=1915356 RepID=A0ABR2KE40_9EUKA
MNDQDVTHQAIVILIDNSDRSIDGDFSPNRLDAQKKTSIHLMMYFTELSTETQVSIGTLGENNIGIAASLTTDREKLSRAIDKIQPSGQIKLYQGIKSAFLALHHRDEKIKNQRIIVFVGSKHDLTPQTSKVLSDTANKEKAAIDIIAFGDSVQDIDILLSLVHNITTKSNFLIVEVGDNLSETVLQSPIGHGNTEMPFGFNDPDLYSYALSYEDSLQRAIEASISECKYTNSNNNNNDEDDKRMQENKIVEQQLEKSYKYMKEQEKKKAEKQKKIEEANRIIADEKKKKAEEKRKKEEEKREKEGENMQDDENEIFEDEEEEEEDSEDEFSDPDLLEAIKLSKQDIQDPNNKNSDDSFNDENNN